MRSSGAVPADAADHAAETFLYFRLQPGDGRTPAARLPEGCRGRWFAPALGVPPLPSHSLATSVVYTLFHHLHVFRSPDFGVYAIHSDGALAHGSTVFPAFFRFPFMQPGDVQIGMVFTPPEFRGRGFAAAAVREIVNAPQFAGRAVWYVVGAQNQPSIRVAERAGFRLVGAGRRKKRCGSGLLGQFVIESRTTAGGD